MNDAANSQLSLWPDGDPPPDVDVECDEKLAALRRQMGEVAWGDRLAEARSRAEAVCAIRRLEGQGLSKAEAFRRVDPPATYPTVLRWITRFDEEGVVGLITRTGLAATCNAGDPVLNPPPRPGRGRRALSFVKWAGGKGRVLPQLLRRVPERFGTYYEPMVGAGTLFLKLSPPRAVLADINCELMTAWEVIRDDVESLCAALERHENTYDHYIAARAEDPDELSPAERAARFIFLNKTCYNGLYRVNLHGRFNVPYGRKGAANFKDFTTLRRISGQLAGTRLLCADFETALEDAGEGDLVYLDPPYLDLGRTSRTFHRYQPEAFGEEGHARLAQVFRDLDARGCHVILSNSNVPMARELYAGYEVEVLRTVRTMNSRTSNRSGWDEVVVSNTRVND